MKKRIFLIVIILVILIFVSLGVLYYAFYKNKNQQENEYGNLDSFVANNTIETTVNNTNTIDDEVNKDILNESNNIVVEDKNIEEHKTDNKTMLASETNQETQTASQSTKTSMKTNTNTKAQTEKQNSTSATNQSNSDKNTESSQTPTNQSEKEENSKAEPIIERCTNNSNHATETGNSGKWFNTEKEAVAYYEALIKECGDKWADNKISNEEYNKNCPYGYEDWDCMYCGKWTINFYYR